MTTGYGKVQILRGVDLYKSDIGVANATRYAYQDNVRRALHG